MFIQRIILLIILMYGFLLKSQNFEWIKSYGNNQFEYSNCIKKSYNGEVFSILNHSSSIDNLDDTLLFDSIRFILPFVKKNFNRGFILRSNDNGKLLDVESFDGITIKDFCIDSLSNTYLIADFKDSAIIGNSRFFSRNGSMIVLKLDQNFAVNWVGQYGNDSTLSSKISVKDSLLYFSCYTGGFVKFGNQYFNLSKVQSGLKNYTIVYGALNGLTGNLTRVNYLYNNVNGHNITINDQKVTDKKSIYFAGNVNSFSTNSIQTIGSDTIRQGGIYILIDSLGIYTKRIELGSDLTSLAISDSNVYITGTFSDSILWRRKFIKSGLQNNIRTFFICKTSLNGFEDWFIVPEVNQSLPNYPAGSLYASVCVNEFLFWSGSMSNKIKIGDSNLSPFISNGGVPSIDILIIKLDLIGNVLWATSAGTQTGTVISMDALPQEGVYLSGRYRGIIHLGANKDTSKQYNNVFAYEDAFLTKLSDNAIIRGEVGKGPYCAGDSIKVPFKKIGDYDTSNYFIAELSDEQGNFTGNHRELGRLKSNNDGIVTGLLPSLSVASSNKYRIRIISTAPAVQSYYKVDTLRLLIYSKDKAWAGNDTVICKGDSLQLETFGGTKWHWSPSYKLLDSTARTTFAWPDKTTTYRITIADSSGCGAPDTAYKTIMVRPELKLSILTPKDTTMCIGGSMPIIASFSGGDSLNYTCQWYSINSLGIFKLEQETILQQADTLQFTMPVNEPDSMRFVLYLSDGCTPKTAFANYTLKVKKQSAQVNFEFKDTSLCPANATVIVVNFTGSPKDKLSWSWQENTSITNQWVQRRTGNTKQSDTWNYTLPLTWKGTKKIRLLLNDACSGLKDTALLNITPKDTLQLQLTTKDTTLCHGQWYTYKALGKGGNKDGYKYVWTDVATGDTLSMADSLKIQANQTLQIRLHLSDGCMPKTTATQFTLTVRAPLKINIANPNDTVLCVGQNFTYVANALGGNGQYSYHWLLDGQAQGSIDSFTLINDGSDIGLKQLKLIVSDGCTKPEDTAVLNINLKPALSQTLTSIDSLCFGASATLKTKASGGIDNYIYQWQDNNTTLSNTDSLKITNTQPGKRTYISIVTDGCSSPDTSKLEVVFLEPLKLQLSTTDSCPTGTTIIRSEVSGGKASQLKVSWFNNNIQIHQGDSLSVNPASYTSRLYTAIASDGCSSENDTANIQIGSAPKIKILAFGECLGDTTRFLAKQMNSTGATNYAWTLNGTSLPFTDSTAFHSFSSTGAYKIKVAVNSNGSCKGGDSLSGFILNKPKAAFTLAHFDRNAQGIPFRFIDQSSGANGWLWNFGNGDTSQRQHPDYTYSDTGKARVTLIVSNNNKCFDSTSLLIPVMDKIEFFMPNVFSPDGNSTNETFGLSANQWSKVKEFNLKIYNCWGEKVFDSDHMEEHWTGEGAQQSVYIYKLTIRDVYNVLHEIEGVVELLE